MTEKVDAAEVILEKTEEAEEVTEVIIEQPPPPVINPEVACMDDFDILRLLGQGGFGIVQLVHCTNQELRVKWALPQFMAMKKVAMGSYISQQMRQSVMKEARFLKKLRNQNLIKMYLSFFEQSKHGHWYFCILMEHAEQGDLLHRLILPAKQNNMKRIPEDIIWRVCKEVCTGLAHLHKK